jgi:hypothetical protein
MPGALRIMAKPNPAKPLSRILASDAQIAAWRERTEQEARLTTAVRRQLPRALADRVRVAEAVPGVLTLAAAAGAVAAVVRQRSPDLLAGLRREGFDFTELRVRVQVRTEPVHSHKPVHKHIVKVDSAPLRRLARDLPDGPLKEAVERLVRRSG